MQSQAQCFLHHLSLCGVVLSLLYYGQMVVRQAFTAIQKQTQRLECVLNITSKSRTVILHVWQFRLRSSGLDLNSAKGKRFDETHIGDRGKYTEETFPCHFRCRLSRQFSQEFIPHLEKALMCLWVAKSKLLSHREITFHKLLLVTYPVQPME